MRVTALSLLDPGRRLPLQCVCLLSVLWLCERVIWVVVFFLFLQTFKCYMCMDCMCDRSGHTWRTSQALVCCISGNDLGMVLSLQVKGMKTHQRNSARKSIQTQLDVRQGYYEKGWRGMKSFSLSLQHQHWMFHLNLGFILCGILIMLPLVWIDSPFTA